MTGGGAAVVGYLPSLSVFLRGNKKFVDPILVVVVSFNILEIRFRVVAGVTGTVTDSIRHPLRI